MSVGEHRDRFRPCPGTYSAETGELTYHRYLKKFYMDELCVLFQVKFNIVNGEISDVMITDL